MGCWHCQRRLNPLCHKAGPKKQISHPRDHSLNALNSHDWAMAKPGAQTSSEVSYVKDRDPGTQAIACCLPRRAFAGNWIRSGVARAQVRHCAVGCRCPRLGVLRCPDVCLKPGLLGGRVTAVPPLRRCPACWESVLLSRLCPLLFMLLTALAG